MLGAAESPAAIAVGNGASEVSILVGGRLKMSDLFGDPGVADDIGVEALPRRCLGIKRQGERDQRALEANGKDVERVLHPPDFALQVLLLVGRRHGSRNQTLLPAVWAAVPQLPAIASTRNRPRPESRSGSCTSFSRGASGTLSSVTVTTTLAPSRSTSSVMRPRACRHAFVISSDVSSSASSATALCCPAR